MVTEGASETTALDLLRLTDGLVVHQALFTAAKLGVADLLKDRARSATDLANSLHVNADALYRMLRFLAGQGVFYESPSRRSLIALCRLRSSDAVFGIHPRIAGEAAQKSGLPTILNPENQIRA